MRFMMLVKSAENSGPPPKELMDAMAKLGEEAVKSGTMLATGGLAPTAMSTRIRLARGAISTMDGPFAETKELIAGFWLWQVRSREEAIEWVKRCPNPMHGESEIEIRKVYEPEDFASIMPDELREREEQLRAKLARSH